MTYSSKGVDQGRDEWRVGDTGCDEAGVAFGSGGMFGAGKLFSANGSTVRRSPRGSCVIILRPGCLFTYLYLATCETLSILDESHIRRDLVQRPGCMIYLYSCRALTFVRQAVGLFILATVGLYVS